MMQLSGYGTFDWTLLGLAAFVIGVAKTGLPGAGVLAIPLAALVLPAKASTGIILPLLIAGDFFAVGWYRRSAKWQHVFRLLPTGCAGILLGYLLLGVISDAQLRPLIGAVILVMMALTEWRERGRGEGPTPRLAFVIGIGVAAGVATMMANAAGPIMALYLLAAGLPKEEFVGTGAWYFFTVNCLKVPFSWHLGLINPESLLLNLCLLPATVVGALAGLYLLRNLSQNRFVTAVKLLTLAGALKLLV